MNVYYRIKTAKHYSWLQRGKLCSIRNIKYNNSLNIITAITSSGYSLSHLKYSTTKSDAIVGFLKVLLQFVWRVDGVEGSKIGIIFDNCQCHRTKLVREFVQKVSPRLYFLPAYTPELAPVKTYFSRLKNNVIKEAGSRSRNLKSNFGMDLIGKVIQSIGHNSKKIFVEGKLRSSKKRDWPTFNIVETLAYLK